MAFDTKEQEIIKLGLENNKSRAEVEQAIKNYRLGQVSKPKQEAKGSTFVARVAEDVKGRIGDVSSQIKNVAAAAREDTSLPLKVAGIATEAGKVPLRAVGAVSGAVSDVIGEGIKEVTGDTAVKTLSQQREENPIYQKLVAALGEDAAKTAADIFNVATLGVGGKTTQVGANVAGKALEGGMQAAERAVPAVELLPKNLVTKAVDLVSDDPEAKVATILKESRPDELNNYLAIAQKASQDPRVATPFEVVGNKLADTTKILEQRLKEIGKAKSDVVTPLREGLGAFKKETKPLIQKLTSLKNSFGEIEQGSKSKVQAIINDAKTISTKLDADTFVDKVQNALYSGNIDMTIPRGSALDKQLRGIIGEYNTSLKNSLPKEYSVLNEKYSKLVDSLDTVNRSLGEVVEGVPVRGASLIKQFFSPSGTKAKEIFEFVKKETNGEIDLAKDSTLAKFSMELFDDPRARSLLQGVGDIPTTLPSIVGKVAEKVGGEKLQKAMTASTIRKATKITLPK